MFPKAIERCIGYLKKLPGIGAKSAERLAFFLLNAPKDYAQNLADAVSRLQSEVRYCSQCGNITDNDPCDFCSDSNRDRTELCIVENALDIAVIEDSGSFRGLYHCLGGLISPLDGVSPSDLNLDGLINRIDELKTHEVIMALSPTTEGDTTSLYIAKMTEGRELRITHLARGIPIGTDLQFAGRSSIAQAMKRREDLK